MVAGIAAGAVAWAPQPGRCGLGAAAWALRRRRAAHCRVQYYPSERSAVDTVQCSRVTLRAPDVDEAGGCQFFLAILRHTLNDGKGPTRLARGGGAPQGREGAPHARHSRLRS
eukprot:COSAG06_NODE_182_length_20899_cov_89.175048_3_plen_113_part_00